MNPHVFCLLVGHWAIPVGRSVKNGGKLEVTLPCSYRSTCLFPVEDKYSVKLSDEEINGFKEIFMMFDKVGECRDTGCSLTVVIFRRY